MEIHDGVMSAGWLSTFITRLADKAVLLKKKWNSKPRYCAEGRKSTGTPLLRKQDHYPEPTRQYNDITQPLDINVLCLNPYEGSEPIYQPFAKARFLHQRLLFLHYDAEDINDNVPTVVKRRFVWEPVSIDEALKATCQVTSPGRDELNVNSIRLVWNVLGEGLTNLFNSCI